MKQVPRYITSVMLRNLSQHVNISLGFEKNGTMRLCFQDPAEMGMDSNYINETAFPNSGLLSKGKYSMWLTMFSKHGAYEDDEFG